MSPALPPVAPDGIRSTASRAPRCTMLCGIPSGKFSYAERSRHRAARGGSPANAFILLIDSGLGSARAEHLPERAARTIRALSEQAVCGRPVGATCAVCE